VLRASVPVSAAVFDTIQLVFQLAGGQLVRDSTVRFYYRLNRQSFRLMVRRRSGAGTCHSAGWSVPGAGGRRRDGNAIVARPAADRPLDAPFAPGSIAPARRFPVVTTTVLRLFFARHSRLHTLRGDRMTSQPTCNPKRRLYYESFRGFRIREATTEAGWPHTLSHLNAVQAAARCGSANISVA